jgi:hypothetical protein
MAIKDIKIKIQELRKWQAIYFLIQFKILQFICKVEDLMHIEINKKHL